MSEIDKIRVEDDEQEVVFAWALAMERVYPCLKLMYHTPTPAQREYMRSLEAEGYFVALCYSASAAVQLIDRYVKGETRV